MDEEIKPENMRIHSRADELIACLEGEIAKRDARILELESQYQRDVYGLNNEGDPIGGDPAGGYANDNARLRSELAAIKAQEPIGWYTEDHLDDKSATTYSWTVAERWVEKGWPVSPLYAAPVSEAKAQCVVMPERWNVPRPMWKDARQPYGNPLNHADIEAAEKFNLALDEVARLNAAPVQQVSVPDGPAKMQWPEIVALVNEVLGCEAHKYPCERGSIGHEMTGINFNSLARIIDRVHRLAAAPAAPAADAPPENCRQRIAAEGKPYPKSSCAVCGKFSPKWRECDAAIAAHRAKGVV